MGTKTIGITEDVYERLAAVKRADESFTDTIERLLDTATADWRHGFGRYTDADGETIERIVSEVIRDHATGFARNQEAVLDSAGIDVEESDNPPSAPDGDGE